MPLTERDQAPRRRKGQSQRKREAVQRRYCRAELALRTMILRRCFVRWHAFVRLALIYSAAAAVHLEPGPDTDTDD
jgi:hypothetical protein